MNSGGAGKTMIIEFNGLPGSGKTTVSEALVKRLESKREFALCWPLKESELKRYISYLVDGSVILYLLGAKLFNLVSKQSGEDNKTVFKKEKGRVFNLIKRYREYKAFYRQAQSNEVLLIDEGVIHGILTLLHGRKLRSTRYLDKLLRFFKKRGVEFVCVECASDISLSDHRIAERGYTCSRLDVCDAEERARILSVQNENLKLIRERVAVIMSPRTVYIDTKESADDNAAYIDKELGLSGLK